MIPPSLIAVLKRAAVPSLITALVVALSMFFVMRPPPLRGPAEKSGLTSGNDAPPAVSPGRPTPPVDRLSSVAVVIMNNGEELPLEIRVGGKYIRIPGPSTWSRGSGKGSADADKNRFLAGIVDTADVLQANGFKGDEAFSFVVGGTELNAANTFRVQGNHQPDMARSSADDYIEEFRTPPGEEGIWRSLKFKNVILSYGQVPSLRDVLESGRTGAAKNPALAQANAGGASTLDEQNSPAAADDGAPTDLPAAARKNIEDLDNSDPTTRANAIRDLVLSGYQQDKDSAGPDIRSLLEKTLADKDPAVRAAALGSLDGWSGSLPVQTLSRMVLNDTIPELRMHAMDLLVDRFAEQALPTLQQAGNDPDLRVAQKARALMAQFSR